MYNLKKKCNIKSSNSMNNKAFDRSYSFTLNLSSTDARELSNSGESKNSQGRIGCRKFESLRTFTFPLSSNANLSVRVKFCIAYASPACKDIIDANSGHTNRLNCNRDTCSMRKEKELITYVSYSEYFYYYCIRYIFRMLAYVNYIRLTLKG